MSLEQLLFLIVFLIFPLLQNLVQERRKKREARAQLLALERDVGSAPHDERKDPPAPPAWQPLPSPIPPLAESTARVVALPQPAPQTSHQSESGSATSAALGVTRQAELSKAALKRAHLRRLVPRDRAGLRRAMLLAEVFGPPRSLDPRRG
jgi:hypothetical protein